MSVYSLESLQWYYEVAVITRLSPEFCGYELGSPCLNSSAFHYIICTNTRKDIQFSKSWMNLQYDRGSFTIYEKARREGLFNNVS